MIKERLEEPYSSPPLFWHEQLSFSLTWVLSWIISYTENLDCRCSGLSLNATGRLCPLPYPTPQRRNRLSWHPVCFPRSTWHQRDCRVASEGISFISASSIQSSSRRLVSWSVLFIAGSWISRTFVQRMNNWKCVFICVWTSWSYGLWPLQLCIWACSVRAWLILSIIGKNTLKNSNHSKLHYRGVFRSIYRTRHCCVEWERREGLEWSVLWIIPPPPLLLPSDPSERKSRRLKEGTRPPSSWI